MTFSSPRSAMGAALVKLPLVAAGGVVVAGGTAVVSAVLFFVPLIVALVFFVLDLDAQMGFHVSLLGWAGLTAAIYVLKLWAAPLAFIIVTLSSAIFWPPLTFTTGLAVILLALACLWASAGD